jgi:hypothetical protein
MARALLSGGTIALIKWTEATDRLKKTRNIFTVSGPDECYTNVCKLNENVNLLAHSKVDDGCNIQWE